MTYAENHEVIKPADELVKAQRNALPPSSSLRRASRFNKRLNPMRELKFRAWDRRNQVMIPFDSPQICQEFSGIIWCSSEYDGIGELPGSYSNKLADWEHPSVQYELMQYTGRKDLTGKEIYEGDRIEWRSTHKGASQELRTDTMVWDDEGACFMLMPWVHEPYAASMTVVGNIYEDSE